MFTIFPTETSQILSDILTITILTYHISDEIPLMVKRTLLIIRDCLAL